MWCGFWLQYVLANALAVCVGPVVMHLGSFKHATAAELLNTLHLRLHAEVFEAAMLLLDVVLGPGTPTLCRRGDSHVQLVICCVVCAASAVVLPRWQLRMAATASSPCLMMQPLRRPSYYKP
jgi:hypothetical protein